MSPVFAGLFRVRRFVPGNAFGAIADNTVNEKRD